MVLLVINFTKKLKIDFLKLIDNFKDVSAAGYDRVMIKLLKHIIKLLVNPLVNI